MYNAILLKAATSTLTNSYYTSIANNEVLATINNNLALKSAITALASYYTKVSIDVLVTTMNNNLAFKSDSTTLNKFILYRSINWCII